MKINKLNLRGFSQHFVMAFIVLVVGVGGAAYLVASHAATPTPILFMQNVPSSTTATTNVATVPNTGGPATVVSTLGDGTWKQDARYSPNHNFVAWKQSPQNGTLTDVIKIYNASTKATTTVSLPTNVYFSNSGSPLVWYPDSTKLVFQAFDGSSSSYGLYLATTSNTTTSKVPGVTIAGTASDAGITSLAVTGDSANIVYVTAAGINQVQVGAAPKLVVATDCATHLRAKPGVNSVVAYACGKFTTTGKKSTATNTVNLLTLGSGSTTVYTSSGSLINGFVNFIDGLSWSPDASKLGVLFNHMTYSNNSTCAGTLTSQTQAASLTFGKKTVVTNLASLPIQSVPNCRGGGWSNDDSMIAWGYGVDQIAFTQYSSSGGGSAIYVASSLAASTPQQIVASDADNINW